jgi:hypothetical protein
MRRKAETVSEAQARHEVAATLKGQEYPPVFNAEAPVFDPTEAETSRVTRFVEEGELPNLAGLDTPEALRALSQVPLEGQSPKEWLADINQTKRDLQTQPQVTVLIPQAAPSKKPLPPVQVQINDYTLLIPRGKPVTIAQEVARALQEGGYLYAQA